MKKRRIGLTLFRILKKILITIIKLLLLLISHEALERKHTEERAKALAGHEAQRRMNEFLSIASHELKTPLTSIKGNIQLMVRRLKSNSSAEPSQPDEVRVLLTEARELLERTDQQITRLTRLVNGLLESARINGNTMDLLFELCELNTLIRETAQDRRHIPATRSIQLDLPGDGAVLVMADANRIKEVVTHYLSNAHKFSHRDSSIEIQLREEGKMARVQVRDQGQGIASSEQKSIWERYYRVPGIEVLNGSEVGLGLGLHICRTIIEQHHGKVGVSSAPGKGSIFWFMVPLMQNNLEGNL